MKLLLNVSTHDYIIDYQTAIDYNTVTRIDKHQQQFSEYEYPKYEDGEIENVKYPKEKIINKYYINYRTSDNETYCQCFETEKHRDKAFDMLVITSMHPINSVIAAINNQIVPTHKK